MATKGVGARGLKWGPHHESASARLGEQRWRKVAPVRTGAPASSSCALDTLNFNSSPACRETGGLAILTTKTHGCVRWAPLGVLPYPLAILLASDAISG